MLKRKCKEAGEGQVSEELMDSIIQLMPGGAMAVYAEMGIPLYAVNQELLKILGYEDDREFLLHTEGRMENAIHPKERQLVYATVKKGFAENGRYKAEYRIQKKDGSYIWISDMGRMVHMENGRIAAIISIMDISQRVFAVEHLKEVAMHDSLTSLYNRRAVIDLIKEHLESEKGYVFLMMDVDNFKLVNDLYGHTMGDRILKKIAEILAEQFTSSVQLGRLGGDEFIVFSEREMAKEEICRRIHAVNQNYCKIADNLCPNSHSALSFGGVYGFGRVKFDDVYVKADTLLYEVKRQQKGGHKIQPF